MDREGNQIWVAPADGVYGFIPVPPDADASAIVIDWGSDDVPDFCLNTAAKNGRPNTNPKIPSMLEAEGGRVTIDSFCDYITIYVDVTEDASVCMTSEEARAVAADLLARADALDVTARSQPG